MQSPTPHKPWYTHRWPWLLMLGPMAAVVAGVYTYHLAASTDDTLVSDDYYKQGKEINLLLERDKLAASMGLLGQAMFSDQGDSVRVIMSSKQALPDKLQLSLLHPTLEKLDQHVALQRVSGNLYQAKLKAASSSHWYVRVEAATSNSWRIQGEWKPAMGNSVTLDPMLPQSK